MDFELTDEQRLIQDTVRAFVDERVLPVAVRNDIDHKLDLDLIAGMAELGVLGVVIPEEYGGAGLDFVSEALACEEIERGEAAFRTWLLTIAWRKALDRRRARNILWRRTRTSAPSDESDPVDLLDAGTASPERAAVARDLARQCRDEIRRLSPKLRDALLLASSGEYSYGEIAAVLGIPLGTVKWRVSEARRIVATRMKMELES